MADTDSPRRHPKVVGDQTTAIVMARLLQIYPVVLLPFGEDQRYDLVIDDGERFLRVQCKTGRVRAGAVRFRACSSTYHWPSNQGIRFCSQSYKGDADLFGVYCSQIDAVYLVPVEEVGNREGFLRIEPTKNNQFKKVRWAKDYEIRKPG